MSVLVVKQYLSLKQAIVAFTVAMAIFLVHQFKKINPVVGSGAIWITKTTGKKSTALKRQMLSVGTPHILRPH